jgi:transglutaminase-like putative cysteine protease
VVGALRRDVSARLELEFLGTSRIVFQVAVSGGARDGLSGRDEETLDVRLNGTSVVPRVLAAGHGGRAHVVESSEGRLVLDYAATIHGDRAPMVTDEPDRLVYLRPSRYAESDLLAGFAVAEFAGLDAEELLAGVSSWVGERLEYVPGSSRSVDGAVATLLVGRGVCRDYAHLVVALLRAMDVPARVVAVYAPGLTPMDFHAVAEAYVEGCWRVVDATLLAPRASMVRIATGRDAADTAFVSIYGDTVNLLECHITATVEGQLPSDDPRDLRSLA